jgi:type IV secretion system protein VirD4
MAGSLYLGQAQLPPDQRRRLPRNNPDGFIFYPGEKHVVTVGPPGCGKSTAILVPNLLRSTHQSMVVVDPKGELAAITAQERRRYGRVVILNPFGVMTRQRPDLVSDCYNPLHHLDHSSRRFPDQVARVAEALIKIEGNDPHWARRARSIVSALIMHVKREWGVGATLGDVRDLMTDPPRMFIETVRQMMTSGYGPLKNKAGRFFQSSNEIESVLATAAGQTECLDSIELADDLSRGDIDFRTLKTETVTVYLILPPECFQTHAVWLRLVLNDALHALLTVPENNRPPVVFMMDEFAAIGRLQVVEDVMGLARGYGVQLWPVFQTLIQAKAIYGDNWEGFIASAGVLQAFAPQDLFTADYLSKRAGQKTMEVESTSRSTSHDGKVSSSVSMSYKDRRLFLPQELMQMPPGMTALFIQEMGNVGLSRVQHYKQMPGLPALAGLNPYDVRYT